MQDSFLAAGQISKSFDGMGINSCPDLHAMIRCAKNTNVLCNIDEFEKNAHPPSRYYAHSGELSKEKLSMCDSNYSMDPDDKI